MAQKHILTDLLLHKNVLQDAQLKDSIVQAVGTNTPVAGQIQYGTDAHGANALQFFNGRDWISTLVSGSYDPVTISGGTVTFSNLSVDKNVISRDNSGTADVLYISTSMTSNNELITLSDVPLHATMVQGQSSAAALYASNARNGAILEGAANQITITGGSGSLTDHIVIGLDDAVTAALSEASSALQGFTIDGNSAVTNKVGAIATTGETQGTGATTPYNASTNPVATKAYVDAAETALTHTMTLTNGTNTIGTYTPTADATIDIPTYSGSTANGLVPGKTSATASTTKYLSEAGSWESLPAAQAITFGSAAASNDTASITVSVDGTPVSSAVVLTAEKDGSTISGEELGITITGNANTPTIGLTANTITELAAAHTALQPVTAVTATDMFATSPDANGNVTVTAQSYAQSTTAQSTVATGTNSFTVGDGVLNIVGKGETIPAEGQTPASLPSAVTTDMFSANDTTSSNLTLGDEFVWDGTNKELGLRVNQAVSATNNIATMQDITAISGAMHYMGGITAYPTATAATKAGDTYIATSSFTHDGVTYEIGDMFVADADGANANFNVVQTNLTIGTDNGEIAPVDMGANNSLGNGEIVTATSNGIATTGYTFDAEATEGTTTITSSSTNAQVPTSKNVYNFVGGYVTNNAVQTVTEATSVSTSNNVATVTDTLTVDSTQQTGNSFSIGAGAGSGINVTSNDNAITIAHTNTITAGIIGTSTVYNPSTQGSGTYVPTVAYDANGHITSQNTTTAEVTASNIHATYNGTTSTDSDTSVQNVLDSIDQRVDALEGATTNGAHKYATTNGALTPSNGECHWEVDITGLNLGSGDNDCVATVKCNDSSQGGWCSSMGIETSEEIECRIIYTSNAQIDIYINSTTNIAAGQLKCVVVG